MNVAVPTIESDMQLLLNKLFVDGGGNDTVRKVINSLSNGGITIDVRCSTHGTGAINLTVENFDPNIYAVVGKVTPFEFWLKGSWKRDKPALEEFVGMVEAVVNGRFEETLWTSNGQIVKAYAKLELSSPAGNRILDMPYRELGHNPFKRLHKQVIRYNPWGVKLMPVTFDDP